MPQQNQKTNAGQLVTAAARDLRIAPRKMRLVTNLIKGLSVGDAMHQLRHLNKKAAPLLAKLLRSAVANAQNNFSIKPESLFVKSITADMGRSLKRYFPRARGSAFVIRRKLSHVSLVLEERKAKPGASRRKFNLFERKAEVQGSGAEPVSQSRETAAPNDTLGKKSQVGKTDEQRKMNKIQQKRRLFNRKAGV